MIYNNLELYNVENLAKTEDDSGLMLSRVPEYVRIKLNERARTMAFNGCGSEIRFNLKTNEAKITLRRDDYDQELNPVGLGEVFYGSFHADYKTSPIYINNSPTEIIIKKPANLDSLKSIAEKYKMAFDPELVRIILPYDVPNILVNIEGDFTPPGREQTPHLRYLAYGSSITHGGSAIDPMGSYAQLTAQQLDVDLINLGFAGSCYLEESMADYIAEREDWDFATLELGINVLNVFTVDEFSNRVDYLISRVAESNKDKWIFCIDIFTCNRDLYADEKINQFRKVVQNKVASINLPRLVYVSAEELLSYPLGLSADLVHPSPLGMIEISRKLSKIIDECIRGES